MVDFLSNWYYNTIEYSTLVRLRHKLQKPSNAAVCERLKIDCFCRKSSHVLGLGSIRDAVRVEKMELFCRKDVEAFKIDLPSAPKRRLHEQIHNVCERSDT